MDQRARSTNIKNGPYAKVDQDRALSWSSAANYYFLAFFVGIFVFVVVLAFLYDGYDESPWVVAALSSIVPIVSFVLFREVVLRRSMERERAARRLAHHLSAAKKHGREREDRDKFTLEHNERFLSEIRSKSEAAKVLGNLAEAHKEVFELCDEYFMIASREISNARVGSPRVPALRKGSIAAAKRHRFHMLKWAELRSRSFTSEAKNADSFDSKIAAAEAALDAVQRAIEVYPNENALTDSREVLQTFLASTRLRSFLDQAEEAEIAGKLESALRNYNNALIELNRHSGAFDDREAFGLKIRSEVGRLERLMENRTSG